MSSGEGLAPPMQGAWVWSLVKELRSYIPHNKAKKKKKKELRTTENQSLLHTYQGDKTYYLEGGITEDKQALPGVIVQSDFSEDK